jgi:hypothetical protein
LNAQQIGCPVSDQLAALAQQIAYGPLFLRINITLG